MPESDFDRLRRDRELMDELLASVEAGVALPGARKLGIKPDAVKAALAKSGRRLESTGGGRPLPRELEAIVRLHMRPSLLVRQGVFAEPQSKVWRQRLDPHRSALHAALPSVGRVDLRRGRKADWCGTAWMVAPGVAITNKHVAEEFARRGKQGGWTFLKVRGAGVIGVGVDFRREQGVAASHKVAVERVLWVWDGDGPIADLALLAVAGDDVPGPIPLAPRDPAADDFIAVVGYPDEDDRNDLKAQQRIFGSAFGVKRFAPGQVMAVAGGLTFRHDCSTLGGNSGSVVLDLATGAAVGLHFAGRYREANHAVKASVIRQGLERGKVTVAAGGREPERAGGGRKAGGGEEHRGGWQVSRKVRAAAQKLEQLRNQKKFSQLVQQGQRCLEQGLDHPTLRRLLAQGQIDTGALDAAIDNLTEVRRGLMRRLAELAGDPDRPDEALYWEEELAEVRGLLGRAHKQRYVDSKPTPKRPNLADAVRAEDFYREAYEPAPAGRYWHGINIVALRNHRLRRAGTDAGERDPVADRIAREVLADLERLAERSQPGFWELATRVEALLALGRTDELEPALTAALAAPGVQPFHRNSLRRQLEELWELDPRQAPGRILLPPLRETAAPAATAPAETARARTAPAKTELDPRSIERQGDRVALSVARLGWDVVRGDGTGFLLDPRLLWPEYAGYSQFVLTNAHVCNADAPRGQKQAPYHPEDVRFAFLGPPQVGAVTAVSARQLWSSPVDELDATLLMVRAPGQPPLPVRKQPLRHGLQTRIVGHPLGGNTWYSDREYELARVDDRCLQYTNATEPGMSGSPVFDDRWHLIGLHRDHDAARQLNGGIRIDRILEAMRADLLARFGPEGPEPYWELEPTA